MVFFARFQYFDHYSYLSYYEQLFDNKSFKDSLNKSRFEPGFVFISHYISRFIHTIELQFFIVASIVLIIKYRLFIKYLHSPYIAWFVYLTIFAPAFESNQLRTAIISTFILYALFYKEKIKKFFLFPTFFGVFFHYGAAIILFLNFERNLFIALLGSIFIIVLSFNMDPLLAFFDSDLIPLKQFISTSNNYLKANIFSSLHIVQFSIFLLGLMNWKNLSLNQRRGVIFLMIGSVLYISLSYNPSIAHRIRELSLLGIMPLLFADKIVFTRSFVGIIFGVGYIASYSMYWHIMRLTIL